MNKPLQVLTLIAAVMFSGAANTAPVSGQGTWETTLQARDLDGNLSTVEAYYDTALNITWLANANVAGSMNWANANAWVAGLNINGITGWRLPATGPVNGSSFNYGYSFNGSADFGFNISAPGSAYPGSTGSEMAHMFYVTLGDKGYYDTSGNSPQAGWGLTNTGPFSNLQSYDYSSATEYAPNTSYAWRFDTIAGGQDRGDKNTGRYAWAVHTGDVGAAIVPVPAAVWLFGSGLLGLIGVARRKKPRTENRCATATTKA